MDDPVGETFDLVIRLTIIALLGRGYSSTFIKLLFADMRGITKLMENGAIPIEVLQEEQAFYAFVKKMYNVDAEDIMEFDADEN